VSVFLLCEAGPVIGGDIDPVLRGEWPGFRRGPARGVAVSGHCAYVATQKGGLSIIEALEPANPQRIGGCDASGEAWGGAIANDVTVSGDYAYVAAGDLQVIDISNPAHPRRVGGWRGLGSVVQRAPTNRELGAPVVCET
jgi:hypothetical protein